MNDFFDKLKDAKSLSPLVLAFIGDSIFDLMVKEYLVANGILNLNRLHKSAVDIVCCTAQAKYAQNLIDILTEEELEVYKRGRNAHTSHTPKHADSIKYHKATGFEALFGYLYLNNNTERLKQIFNKVIQYD